MNRHAPIVEGHADQPVHPMLRLILCGPAQFGVGLMVACIVPMLIGNDFRLLQGLSSVSQYHSFIATACAVSIGYFLARRLGRHSYHKCLSHILPAFSIGYAIMICVIVFWRLEYSRFIIIFGFLNAQIWFHAITIIAKRLNRPRYHIIPFDNAENLIAIPHVHWKFLMVPDPLQLRHTDGIVADLRSDMPVIWERFIAEAALKGVPVHHFKRLREDLTGELEIEHLTENNLVSQFPAYFYLMIKQSIDMAFAILILPVVLPVIAFCAIAIKCDSTGPVFFRQQRMGFRGQVFTMWKLRTMQHNHRRGAEERVAAMTHNCDPRITRVGRFLRKTRLDELPQIINVLRGEMSWIGPRPEAVSLSLWYEQDIAFYCYRHVVPPGITGWAQVNQGHVTAVDDVRRKLKYDFYYIKHFSVWLDVLITLRTIPIMLSGFGAR